MVIIFFSSDFILYYLFDKSQMVYDAIAVDLQVHWSRLDILALPNSGQFSAKNRLIVGTSGKKY